ncbi:hypothetical protein VaNZ11_002733 [Volvox africanus]|uniref:SET domain-containing protein n=1 Tax=Volvox africanus TaxID=51714 RepID=A0ABQ5RTM7_9CHLO|nr:hypothetical protein VaNZ11_002733 [Volvox africanus]
MSLLLLQSYDGESQLSYYNQVLLNANASSFEVILDVNGKGKGLVATRDITEGTTVFIERPLVHLQHLDNRGSAIVCQACLRFVGSIERQVGHKLRCLVDQLRGAQRGTSLSDGDGGDESEIDLDGALEAGERLEQIYSHVTPEGIAELCSGTAKLPLSDGFQLPDPVPCRRGCVALYCSAACEAEAWEHSHCLLCPVSTSTGPAAAAAPAGAYSPGSAQAAVTHSGGHSDTAEAVSSPDAATNSTGQPTSYDSARADGTAGGSAEAAAGGGPASAGPGPSCFSGGPTAASPSVTAPTEAVMEELCGISIDRRALVSFWEHARETNEIFLLAAQVVAVTLLKAARLVQVDELSEGAPVATTPGPSSQAAGSSSNACQSALLAAWRPFMYGWKRCWWEAVAVPDDVDDEEEFRAQLRSLASDSLELLSAAIKDPRFGPDLFQLQVYGSIVGMFELNNMGLIVPSPVEDYFLEVDEMEEGTEKREVTQVTQPLLDALDAEYATPCEATAFLALQSCINHSCDPNCTAACDTGDRTVTILAQRDIPAGEEITVSYIDLSLPYKERQADLRDYGFVCRCVRCVAEAAEARAKRKGTAKGVKVGRRR